MARSSIKVIIFDLDDTLIDTKPLEPLRNARRWHEISKYINRCSVYEDVLGLLNSSRALGLKIAIFSNSPSGYVQSLLKHFDIIVDFVVSYHDVKNHKPHKDGVENILAYFEAERDETLYIGDSNLDKDAAANAGVEFFTVEWGSATNVDHEHIGVSSLSKLIGSGLSLRSDVSLRSKLQRSGNKLYLGYYLEGIKQEVWSFKDGVETSVSRWINKSLELAEQFPVIDVVVRALGHAELRVSGSDKPLDKLSFSLANTLGATYKPELIEKKNKLVKSTKISAAERKSQVTGAYFISSDRTSVSRGSKLTFLIVDDVYTSGATTSEISRVLMEAYPEANIYVFTLVKTIYRAEADRASMEWKLNAQLFTDLYGSLVEDRNQKLSPSRKYSSKLETKQYSANYVRTNNNFIFHNLQSSSIESEPGSSCIFKAIQILKNMLQRGKPTIPSRSLRSAFGLNLTEMGLLQVPLALISDRSLVWRRLIRGDVKSGQYPAKRFFDDLLPKYLGSYGFVKQLTVPEARIFDMTQIYVDQFHNDQVDFFIPQVGLIIEIDGDQHRSSKKTDASRDEFTETLGLKTVRFTTQEIASENTSFSRKMAWIRAYIEQIDILEQEGILNPPNELTLRDYQRVFLEGVDRADPRIRLTAAIRFQLLLLELLERGGLRLGEPKKLLVINRDKIDFSQAALDDLNEIMAHLLNLQGSSEGLFDLAIEEVDEIPTSRTGLDIVIDFSILERYDDKFQVNQDVVYVRTHYFDFYRCFTSRDAGTIETSKLVEYDFFQISCTDPISYNLDLSPNSPQRESLRYFLSNLFLPFLDDVDFREGQVGIIGSALSRRSTIGLLPTGSGKSICYQLSAVLQPAVSFVVSPIKSLMYDQKVDLDRIGLTRSNFITSDQRADEKAEIQRDFGRGKYFFVFISPERFQTNGFRKEMQAIGLDLSFAYAVIDEAHCLSEWGHDFRTSYLNLAKTIEKFASGSTYIGLTATASVNVLKDMQAEFNIPDDYVRTPLDFTREELVFHVIDDKGRKQDATVKLVNEMEEKWNNGSDSVLKAGIVFTPNVNGSKGCYAIAGRLSSVLNMEVRFFSGSKPKNGGFSDATFDKYKRSVQEDFKDGKYHLLTATKAFGMGINKGNIAYTIHFGIPGSMEALYQEAGRAGRDKKLFKEVPADCHVLLTKEANAVDLEKIWHPSTSVAVLKESVKALSHDSDLKTNLFLMTNGLDTIGDEFKLISAIYDHLINNEERQVITLDARQFGAEKFKFEKAIYRLSQLGIVLDWIIEDFFRGILQIDFEILPENILEHNIENAIKKYDPEFKLGDIFLSEKKYYKIISDRFNSGTINKTKSIFLVLLLWSYDHFVYNRRQSLKNVYEQCTALTDGRIDGSEFKNRLERYFKHDKSSIKLLQMVESSADVNIWLSIFFDESDKGEGHIISVDTLSTLKGQISRILESYKDNPCLDYLSGLVRLSADEFDDADGERRMSSSIDRLLSADRASALTLVRQTLRLKPLFSEDAQSRFARFVYLKFDDLGVLKEVNEAFKDPYSYYQLIKPLLHRLDKVSAFYRGARF